MGAVNYEKIVAFRHQLWLEHVQVLEEYRRNNSTYFVLEEESLPSYTLVNLMNILPFGILKLYYEGNSKLVLSILNEW